MVETPNIDSSLHTHTYTQTNTHYIYTYMTDLEWITQLNGRGVALPSQHKARPTLEFQHPQRNQLKDHVIRVDVYSVILGQGTILEQERQDSGFQNINGSYEWPAGSIYH